MPNDLLSGYPVPGTKGCSKLEYQTIAPGATIDLLPTVNGEGYIDFMFLAVPYGATLNITTDGGLTYSGDVQLYFAAEYADTQPAFGSRWKQANGNNSPGSAVGLASWLPIPFSSSIRVQLTNNSASQATIWSTISYQTNVPTTNFDLSRKMFVSSGRFLSVAPNTVLTLLDVSNLNPGRLGGIYWHYDGYPGNVVPRSAPLEGNFQIYVDGNSAPSYESSGTEDYFGMSNYFKDFGIADLTLTGSQHAAVSSGFGDSVLTIKTPQDPSNTLAAFRIHARDAIAFQNALKIQWQCGNTSQASFTGKSRIAYCVWYYTT